MSELKHMERLLRKVSFNNDGSAEVSWKDYYLNPETNKYSHNNVTHPGRTNGEVMLIHEDLKRAMDPFIEHWLIFGEEVPEPKTNYPFDASIKRIEQTKVTSVTLSGGEPEPDTGEERKPLAVHIQGTYKLKCGRVRNYCLPGIKITAPQEKYKFAVQVAEHLATLEAEAYAYVMGKVTPPAQLVMNLEPANPEDGADVKLLQEVN